MPGHPWVIKLIVIHELLHDFVLEFSGSAVTGPESELIAMQLKLQHGV